MRGPRLAPPVGVAPAVPSAPAAPGATAVPAAPDVPGATAAPAALVAPTVGVLAALAWAVLALTLAPASAHGTFEANELEVHLVNDEGTDVMQEYGGYDVNEVFLGAAHDPALGDGIYLRIEAYGTYRAESVPPGAPWTLLVRLEANGTAVERSIETTDGAAFTHTFDALLVEAEGLELHVQRAFLSLAGLGLPPGGTVANISVSSLVGGELRDAAPGPLYLPGTGGQVPYDDPTAIEGRGALVASVPAPSPAIYLQPARLSGQLHDYRIEVDSSLAKGGQHVYLSGESADWTVEHSGAVSVEAGGTASFTLRAVPAEGAGPLRMDLLTDVGGRVPVTVEPDGTLRVGEATFTPEAPPPEAAPAAGALLALGLVAAAWARRRA